MQNECVSRLIRNSFNFNHIFLGQIYLIIKDVNILS
jgi:hypothetical protein